MKLMGKSFVVFEIVWRFTGSIVGCWALIKENVQLHTGKKETKKGLSRAAKKREELGCRRGSFDWPFFFVVVVPTLLEI